MKKHLRKLKYSAAVPVLVGLLSIASAQAQVTWSGGNYTTGATGTSGSGTALTLTSSAGSSTAYTLDANVTFGSLALTNGGFYYSGITGASATNTLTFAGSTPVFNTTPSSGFGGVFFLGNMTIAGTQGLTVETGYNTLILNTGLSWTATGTMAFGQPGTDNPAVFASGNNVLATNMDLNITSGWNTGSPSLITLNGGTTQTIGALTGNASGSYIASYDSVNQVNGGTATNGGRGGGGFSGTRGLATLQIGNTGGSATFAGVLGATANDNSTNTQNLAIVKLGAGTQTFTGANVYSGTTTINAGELDINGTNSGTGSVTINSGGKLGGTGKIAGAVTLTSGGNLTPGTNGAVGTLTLTNGLSLAGTTTFNLAATNSFSSINLSNSAVTYGGALVFNLTSAQSSWTTNDVYNVFENLGSTASDFSSVALQGGVSGSFTDNGGIWTLTTGTNTLTYTDSTGTLSVSAVPEPGAHILLGLGILVMAITYMRRRSA